jgi:hypothetical protein
VRVPSPQPAPRITQSAAVFALYLYCSAVQKQHAAHCAIAYLFDVTPASDVPDAQHAQHTLSTPGSACWQRYRLCSVLVNWIPAGTTFGRHASVPASRSTDRGLVGCKWLSGSFACLLEPPLPPLRASRVRVLLTLIRPGLPTVYCSQRLTASSRSTRFTYMGWWHTVRTSECRTHVIR